jgi:DNA-binding CsgD family transcriptional regulator
MSVQADALLGRERELLTLAGFLSSAQAGPAAVALDGEPGIGKTTLFGYALEDARARDYEVLCSRPTSAEQALSFVGLTDLLAGVHHVFPDLASPQRRGLEVALLLDEAGEIEPDPRAIGLGLLAILRSLAASRPVVVSVDDLQWLDAPSAAALSFAFRRLNDEPIGLLVTVRTGMEAAPADLVRDGHCERVSVGPLSAGAIHALLAERVELAVPRSLLLRIHEACRGNPLFALEIGKALKERGLPEPGRPFEIPADVETLFAARLEQLPEQTLDALAVAATTSAPTTALVGAVTGRGEPDLEFAVSAGVVRVEAERVYFTHPLLASAVYARLDADGRQRLHRRIAAALADPEQHARHLALAADAPDGDVAAALDDAAERALLRGAPASAAELAELALRLTPSDDAERRRTRKRVAAQRHFLAGDSARSREALEQLVDELAFGPERASALLQLAEAHSGRHVAMLPLREQAVVEAAGDDHVLAFALHELSRTLSVTGDPARGLACAREAASAAERAQDVRLTAANLALLAWCEIRQGRLTPGLLERALALEERTGYLRDYDSPATIDGLRLMLLDDDLAGARARLTAAEATMRDHGDDEARAILSGHLADLECRAGRLDVAAQHASEALELRQQFGLPTGAQLYAVALVAALRGDRESATVSAECGAAECEKVGYELFAVRNRHVLGLLALSTCDFSTGFRILTPLSDRLAAHGYSGPGVLPVHADAVEAAVGTGELAWARARLVQLDEMARRLGSASARVREARCRALLAAASRDYRAAREALEEALAAHERLPDPLERARTLLAVGQVERRAGKRCDAREALQQARAIMESAGATLWAAQALTELGRLGGRRGSGRTLTGAEERVAGLVAEGKTNREVAAALFVTERTVETHLSSVYRKLGVRSRSELARRLAGAAERSS